MEVSPDLLHPEYKRDNIIGEILSIPQRLEFLIIVSFTYPIFTLLTYIGLYDRCDTREYQGAAQGDGLPNPTRTDGTIDLAELRPNRDIRVPV